MALAWLAPALIFALLGFMEKQILEPFLLAIPFLGLATFIFRLGKNAGSWGQVRRWRGRLQKKEFYFSSRGRPAAVKRWYLESEHIAAFAHPALRKHAVSGASCEFAYIDFPEGHWLCQYPQALVVAIDGFSVAAHLVEKDLKHLSGNGAGLLSLLAVLLFLIILLMIMGELLNGFFILPCIALGVVTIGRIRSHFRLRSRIGKAFQEHLERL